MRGTYHAATSRRHTRTKPPMRPPMMKFSTNSAAPPPRAVSYTHLIFRASLKEEPEDEAEPAALPDFTEGQTFDQVEASVTEHFTTPPKVHTEDTLLSAMENAGKAVSYTHLQSGDLL